MAMRLIICLLVLWGIPGLATEILKKDDIEKVLPVPPRQVATRAMPSSRLLNFTVQGESPWSDTGIDVIVGDRLQIDVQLKSMETSSRREILCHPEGKVRNWSDVLVALPLSTSGEDALIGRIGQTEAVPFLVGAHRGFTTIQSGRLFLGINKMAADHSNCRFNTRILIIHPSETRTVEAHRHKIRIQQNLLEHLPRRVADAAGNKGDMVNFLIVGSRDSMEAAFEAAGWVAVDRTRQDAIIHAVLASMGKQTYTEMPMSELYLYGRVQDYGFARAQPIDVMTSRHHLRIWQAPFEIGATPVWVGAATHDIGFEQDQRDGSITHKIDPNVDGERDFVGKTFKASGATDITYMRPRNAVSHATTATGGRFHSDGRVLILDLGSRTRATW